MVIGVVNMKKIDRLLALLLVIAPAVASAQISLVTPSSTSGKSASTSSPAMGAASRSTPRPARGFT